MWERSHDADAAPCGRPPGAFYAGPVTTPSAPGPPAPTALIRRARRIDRLLAARYPDARCELDHGSPFELLVATVLSAQTTDVRVNQVTPALFARWPDPAALAGADLTEVEAVIRPTGFFRVKARSLRGLAHDLVTRFDGEVPATMADLVALPGVGRKTANVVLGNAFGVPGLPVDTHVLRVSGRLGLTASQDPLAVEADLAALFPPRDWTMVSHRLIFHGRRTCHARRPACGACPLAGLCPAFGAGETDPVAARRLVTDLPAPATPAAPG